MFEHFSDASRQIVVRAQEEAKRLRHTTIGREHLILGILHIAPDVLSAFGSTREQAEAAANATHEVVDRTPTGHMPFDEGIRDIFGAANHVSAVMRAPFIEPHHLAAGIALYTGAA